MASRALPDTTVLSGSPAKFQSPDSPKTGRSPDARLLSLAKIEKNLKKNPKKKFFLVYLFGLGTFDIKFVFMNLIL